MVAKVIPQWRESEIIAEPWEIVRTVELPPGEFRHFKEDLLRAQPFIAEHASEMYMDEHGITHGMLVLCEGIDDGILVNSEGFSYARYAAYLSGARTLSLMDRYPTLRDFCVQMDALVDKYVQQAIAGQEDGQFTISYAELDKDVVKEIFDENLTAFDWRLFLDMLSERPEIQCMTPGESGVIEISLAEPYCQTNAPEQTM